MEVELDETSEDEKRLTTKRGFPGAFSNRVLVVISSIPGYPSGKGKSLEVCQLQPHNQYRHGDADIMTILLHLHPHHRLRP